MVETTENQICYPFCLLCVVLLVSSIVLTSFLGLGFSPILFTIPIMILSTSFLVTFTKKRKVVLAENPSSTKLQVEEKIVMETVSESGAVQEADIGIVNEYQVESLDLTTESGSSNESGSSENLQLNWMISGNVELQNPEISDDSPSEDDEEEEGLIEIAIPSNGSNLPTFLPESIFKQQDLVEFLAEMNNEVNEEENLIEIDISMGSIKCPRFEIEA